MRKVIGSTRIVFVFEKFVVKIPRLTKYSSALYGLLSNLQEREYSLKHCDLAKVLFGDFLGFIVVMERADALSCKTTNEIEFAQMLEEKYKNDELKHFMLYDAIPENWGHINGRLIKIDYGL